MADEDVLPADEDVPSASLAAGFAERGGPSSTTSIGTLLLGGFPADWGGLSHEKSGYRKDTHTRALFRSLLDLRQLLLDRVVIGFPL